MNYTISGTNQLLTVPYALHAKTAETISEPIVENDPVFEASPASDIEVVDIGNWNEAYGWGDHSEEDYLTEETDPEFNATFNFENALDGDILGYDAITEQWVNFSPDYMGSKVEVQKHRALITFIFDDGFEEDYSVAKPIFDAKGIAGVSAIITNRIGLDGKLTINQILKLQDAGWEVASHTISHPHLSTLTEQLIHEELGESKEILESLGFEINNLVYPFHDHDETVRRIARNYYRSAKGRHSGITSNPINTYQLNSLQIDDHTNIDAYKLFVDIAENEKKWMIFYMHKTTPAKAEMLERFMMKFF